MNDDKIKSNEKELFFSCTARTAAQYSGIALFLALAIFCLGYSIGYHQALQESLRGIQKESLAQEVYANVFFVNNEGQQSEEESDDEKGHSVALSEHTDLEKEWPDNKMLFTARLIGYPETHKRSAGQFVEKWKKRGISLIIIEHATHKAKNKRWVQVILEPHSNKAQIEFLADVISKEEKLTDVIVELYPFEEKSI